MWRHISSAPEDEHFWAFCPYSENIEDMYLVAIWDKEAGAFYNYDEQIVPTHWQPLPEAPKGIEVEKDISF